MELRIKIRAGCVIVLAVALLISPMAARAQIPEGAAFLRGGHIGRDEWAAYVERPESQAERAAGFVCPSITMLEFAGREAGEGSSVASCGPVPTDQPTVEYIRGGRRGRIRTVVAVLFPPEVRRVKMRLRGRPAISLAAQHVTLPAYAGLSPVPLAAVVRGFAGRVCIESLLGIDAKGTVLSRLGHPGCSP
jgi:hypothetical protein